MLFDLDTTLHGWLGVKTPSIYAAIWFVDMLWNSEMCHKQSESECWLNCIAVHVVWLWYDPSPIDDWVWNVRRVSIQLSDMLWHSELCHNKHWIRMLTCIAMYVVWPWYDPSRMTGCKTPSIYLAIWFVDMLWNSEMCHKQWIDMLFCPDTTLGG